MIKHAADITCVPLLPPVASQQRFVSHIQKCEKKHGTESVEGEKVKEQQSPFLPPRNNDSVQQFLSYDKKN